MSNIAASNILASNTLTSNTITITNVEKYYLEIIDGNIILTPKETHMLTLTPNNDYISEDELNRIILNSSKILECIVKNGEEVITKKPSICQF